MVMIFMIKCRHISKGRAIGELIVSNEPISFLGGVNPDTGEVIDPHHELNGQFIKDKILFIPGGKGSTVGSYVIFQMKKNGTAPKAIICLTAEPIIATGAIMSDIPMVDSPSSTHGLSNGVKVEVDCDNNLINILS
jgi:predicted aconitase with swiveling domain